MDNFIQLCSKVYIPLQKLQIYGESLTTLSSSDCMIFLINLFTLRITKRLLHKYNKSCKHSLMLQKETQCIKRWGGVKTLEQDDDVYISGLVI